MVVSAPAVCIMRVILQNHESNLYYKGSNAWTLDPREAVDFAQIWRALDFALTYSLQKLDLVLAFTSPQVSARVPANW